MAVDQVSARPVQSLTSAGTQDAAGLKEGTQLEGRVLAVNSDDSLRLATRYGLIDVDQSQVTLVAGGGGGHGKGKMPPAADLVGTTVKLEVTGQSAASGRLLVKLVSAGDPQSTSAQEAATPKAEMAARIAAEVSQAAARQDGLAPVFAGAQQMAAADAGLDAALLQAVQDLGGHALDGDATLSGEDIRAAVSSSGLFLEAKLARWAAGSGLAANGFRLNPAAPLAGQDLKAALFSLKSVLDDWIDRTKPTVLAPPTEATSSTAADGEASSVAGDLVPARPSGAGEGLTQFDNDALFAVLRPPPIVQSQTPASLPGQQMSGGLIAQVAIGQFAGTAGRPDLASLAALGAWFEATGLQPGATGRRGAYGGRPSTPSARSGRSMDDRAPSARPPPPRRGTLPQGQAAVRLPLGREPLEIARELAQKAGNALARISLGQYASLPDPVAASTASPNKAGQSQPNTSWLFEIPLRIGEAVNIAQFEIDRMREGGSATSELVTTWRVQFSLDVEPLGPIHARLVLADHRLSVGLWAEERSGLALLQRNLVVLRQSLERAQFGVDDIHLAEGRPPSGPPVQAGGFIDRNA